MEDSCCSSNHTVKIGEHFDGRASNHAKRYESYGLEPSSRLLMQFLVDNQLSGRTILDLGSGTGVFSIEALKNGASSAVGIDLSSEMVSTANKLANSNGLGEKAKFQVGDAALLSHPASDIVVLDKVICCYPTMEPLLSRAMEASKDTLGIIVPRDKGPLKILVRVGVFFENLTTKLKKSQALMHLHPLGLAHEILAREGFTLDNSRSSGFWLILVYRRKGKRV